MSNDNQKENKEVSIKPFIILFLISIVIFAIIYFFHSKNIENRFNNTLQNYEKSMSAIFNNMAITNGNNENIYTNSLQTNNIENLKLSFEVGFKILESSMNEIMKNSNDILQFWFAFLSVIMIVFTIIGFFLNNNILDSAKKQLEIVEREAKTSRENIEKETKRLIEENNKNINITNLFNLSTQAYNIKDYNLSINYLNEIIKIYEDDFNNKKYDEKSDSYNKARKNCAIAYNNRGNTKSDLRKYDEAINDYNKAIELNLNYSEAYNNRGSIEVDLGNYDKAIKYFDKAIELNLNYSEAYNNRGVAKWHLANIKERNSEEYNKLIKEVMEDYNKAMELNPNLYKTYNNIGAYKIYFGKYDEAINNFNKAIELNLNYSEAYNNRGLAKLQLGKIEEAIKDFIKSYELDDDNEAKEKTKNRLINLSKQGYKKAIKFCKEHNINYKDNDNKE